MHKLFKTISKSETGIAAVEFAVIAPVFLSLVFGAMELGYEAMIRGTAQGAMQEAAREGTLQNATAAAIELQARDRLAGMVPPSGISVSAKNFRKLSHSSTAEKITKDVSPLGGPPGAGDCFEDMQTNGVYDANMSGLNGLGEADDMIRVTMNITFNRLTPVAPLFGLGSYKTMSISTVTQREPFADATVIPEVCLPLSTSNVSSGAIN
jgi:hypothetical protein